MENKNNKKNRVLPQMFDVRPVDAEGFLDMERINSSRRVLRLEPKSVPEAKRSFAADSVRTRPFHDIRRSPAVKKEKKVAVAWESAGPYRPDEDYGMRDVAIDLDFSNRPSILRKEEVENNFFGGIPADKEFPEEDRKEERFLSEDHFRKEGFPAGTDLPEVLDWSKRRRFALAFLSISLMLFFSIAGVGFFYRGIKAKDSILSAGKDAYANLALAKEGMFGRDFQKSSFQFEEAYGRFEEITEDIDNLGGILVEPTRFVPFLSKISSGDHLAQAGKDVSRIGILAGGIMETLEEVKNPLAEGGESISFLKIFQDTDRDLREISELLSSLEDHLSKVNVDDIPEERRIQFIELRSKLPEIRRFLDGFVANNKIFIDILGGNGPRKYLFLFQNNQEMRATGGFIGTYGVMDIFDGNIRKFFIDGIFNPDGQLREKVIPPAPIQKISAAWSLHDSNWFPDFPVSAEKAAWFYEKTGGPTVDGIITMTPVVMQELLEVTGPIEMPEYGVMIDKENFIEAVQQEVEVDYDKDLNQPKKILADLAPKILDRIFNAKNFSDMAKTAGILVRSLDEKQILIYSKNYEIEKILSEEGWSGEVLDTEKDYLSVINTNINGYKTDGVIDESISHQAEIAPDGTVVDTVTITRHHNGGNMDKDWWNKVNANYMRVYVPKGSVLLSAEGHTREFNSPPLDYKALGFKTDAQVQMEEDTMRIDEETGTRIYEDADKTVFANWTYVSPQETVVVKYRYRLPFKIDPGPKSGPDTYSLLVQKQSGSLGSHFSSEMIYADSYESIWIYPESASEEGKSIKLETDLRSDRFFGAAFMEK